MTPRGALLSLGVLVAFLAVFVPLARRINGGRDLAVDADRLRRTYAALALYETTHDGLPAPRLELVAIDLDKGDLQSVADPLVIEPQRDAAKAGLYPYDAALPNCPSTSAFRVSWSYRWHWPEAGDGRSVQEDSRRGLLADWWNGPVQRVNMDGSLVEKPSRELSFSTLFDK